MNVVGILLAGGSASRFGSNKLLHPLDDGTPIAVAAARNLRAALPRVVAVVRPDSEPLEQALRAADVTVSVCPRAQEGMGCTLAHAIAQAVRADGWVIALGDMPFIAPDTIRSVMKALDAGALIAAPRFRGERGHPVAIESSLRDELLALTGDAGARELLRRHAQSIVHVDCDDAGVLRDIDTPADLARG